MKDKSVKKRIFEIIQIGNREDLPSFIFDCVIVFLIVASISVAFLQTFDNLASYHKMFTTVENIAMTVFLIEYGLRIWTADYLFQDKKGLAAKGKFIVSFYGIIDLITFLPLIMPFLLPGGAVALRMFRVVRILRLFRINANYDAFNVITDVLKDKKDQIISSFFLVLVLMLASSLCMYGLEHDAQPENFSNAFSGIWWSVSTLLTVGYGDIYPITVGGRIMAIVIAFLGVGMVAIPTGIISAGFVEYYSQIKQGIYQKYEEDFLTLEITNGHVYCNKKVSELDLVEGMYLALIIREDRVLLNKPDVVIKQGDLLMIGTKSSARIEANIEDVELVSGHPWIDKKIKELDLSRRAYIVMIKRKHKVICPEGSTVLKQDDSLLVFRH